MSKSTSTSTKGYQITIPSDFPVPQFSIGQQVLFTQDTWNKTGKKIEARVVGMEYTSRDAALAEDSYPGWNYTLETPAFQCAEPHHFCLEEDMEAIE